MTHDHEHAEPGQGVTTTQIALWAFLALAAAALIGLRLGRGPELAVGNWLFLIPLLPGVAALLNGVFLNRLSRPLVTALALGSVGLSFVISVVCFVTMKATGEPLRQTLYTWMAAGDLSLDIAYLMDPLSGLMALVVTGVGGLIHLYSVGYMAHDPSYARFFTYLNLFMFAMLTLVLGSSLPLMFVGWEGVGLCSYLLIGFWFTDEAKAIAGKKAFIVNRIGDVGFMIGMLILFSQIGSLDYGDLALKAKTLTPAVATTVALLLFLGATGKSAQFPLYIWLPDAMAGPTPVSALIHAATMVTAGVYMIARLSFLFVLSPTAMMVVASVGAGTALFAATIGLFQHDIKKVLAYSTVSQLGFMFMGVGVGAFAVGIFHLMTHAFFKACLFLGSGSVIHGMHEEQDIRKMGGLMKFMPVTGTTFLISCIAIAGFPPLAAFFSKDEILYKVFTVHYGGPAWYGVLLWAVGMIAAFCTSFYMFRLYYMTFSGECRAPEEIKAKGIHESPRVMTVPLVVLAVLAVVGGWIGMPHLFHVPNLFELNLTQTFAVANNAVGTQHGSAALEITLMALSVLVALSGWLLARALYKDGRSEAPARFMARFRRLHTLVYNKYYVDEAYFWVLVRPLIQVSLFLWGFVDTYLVGGVLVRLSAWVVRSCGEGLRYAQTGNVQTYLLVFLIGAAACLLYLWQGALL